MTDPDPPTGLRAAFTGAFATTTRQLLAAMSAAFVAVVVATLSPVGDKVRDWIWTEKIAVSAPPVVADEGARAPLKIVLSDTSGGGISGGSVRIVSPDGSVVVHNGDFAFARSAGSVNLAPAGLSIEPRAPGVSRLDVLVTTNKGTRVAGHVDVRTTAVAVAPSERSMAGSWRAILNGIEGDLTLIDTTHRLTGSLTLDDGTALQVVNGWYDSRPFAVKLRAPDGTLYAIEGIHCIIGPPASRWAVVNARVTTLRAGSPAPLPTRLEGFPQQCPPEPGGKSFAEEIAFYKGDGTFFATASVR